MVSGGGPGVARHGWRAALGSRWPGGGYIRLLLQLVGVTPFVALGNATNYADGNARRRVGGAAGNCSVHDTLYVDTMLNVMCIAMPYACKLIY